MCTSAIDRCDCYHEGFDDAEEEFFEKSTDLSVYDALLNSERLRECIWRLQIHENCWCGSGSSSREHTDSRQEFRIFFQQNPYKGA